MIRLTPSQERVLRGIAEGKANKQIAYDLGCGEATVKSHVSALMKTHGRAWNRVGLALWCLSRLEPHDRDAVIALGAPRPPPVGAGG